MSYLQATKEKISSQNQTGQLIYMIKRSNLTTQVPSHKPYYPGFHHEVTLTIQVPSHKPYYPGFLFKVTLLPRFLLIALLSRLSSQSNPTIQVLSRKPYYTGSHPEVTLLSRFLLIALLSRLASRSNTTIQVPSHSTTVVSQNLHSHLSRFFSHDLL